MKTLLVIPAFNEEMNIKGVIEELEQVNSEVSYVIINDGSFDSTRQVCIENKFNMIDLDVNLGLTEAFRTGMFYALENDYDCVIQFDADGQHIPTYLNAMIEGIKNGNDVVIGSRFINHKEKFSLRIVGSKLIKLAIKIRTKKTITDPTSGFRAFNKDIIKMFCTDVNLKPEPCTIVYLLNRKKKVKEIHVEMRNRSGGESYLTLGTSIKYMYNALINIIFLENIDRRKK